MREDRSIAMKRLGEISWAPLWRRLSAGIPQTDRTDLSGTMTEEAPGGKNGGGIPTQARSGGALGTQTELMNAGGPATTLGHRGSGG